MTKLAAPAVAVVLLLVPACGGGDSPPEQPAAPAPEETTTAAEEPAGPLPAIVVDKPKPGDEVESPLDVAGSANVFEANVTVRLLDRTGDEISRGFTTATCGSGCRGDFVTQVVFRTTKKQRGTLVVQDDDADGDGKPQHEVRIAVTLLPSPR